MRVAQRGDRGGVYEAVKGGRARPRGGVASGAGTRGLPHVAPGELHSITRPQPYLGARRVSRRRSGGLKCLDCR
jgi:hypothetical protein